MADDLNINTSSKNVDGERAERQAERLAEIAAKQAADRKAAEDAHAQQLAEAKAAKEAAEKAKAEAEAAAKKSAEQLETLSKLGAAALAATGATAAGVAAKKSSSIKGKLILLAVIALIAFMVFLAWPRIEAAINPAPAVHTASQLNSTVLGRTGTEISNAVLGEARQRQELIVWEQDVQVDSEITTALANIDIFRKTKNIRSFGTGVYTVDMGKIDESSIAVDEKAHTVVLSIPRTQLQYVTKDLEATEFEDTQHAILGFGDIKLTQEQQNQLEQQIEASMRDQLVTPENFAAADSAALLVVYDVYQPLIAKIDNSYNLEVVFAEERN